MRAFIGLELPPSLKDAAAGVSADLARLLHGRFLSSDGYHLTLAFLGEVDARQVELACRALDRSVAGREPVELVPEGLGTFGRPIDATLWLGVADTPELSDLASDLCAELRASGVPFDEASFVPHVTIARRARILRDALPPLPSVPSAPAPRATLFESVLTPEGAVYRPVYSVDFGG